MQDFIQQFFSRKTVGVLSGLLVIHIIAALVQDTVWAWIPLVAIGFGVVVASYKKLEWGLALAFLEIFIGGHGHLFDVDVAGFSLSIREVIFAIVMSVWFIQLLQKRLRPEFIGHRDWPLAVIALAVLIGTVIGFATNDLSAAFDDMNGYLTLLYFFPMISLPWTSEQRRLLLQTLAVAAVWVAGTTIVYLFAFTHLPGKASHELYTFVRDSRLVEVTLQTSSYTWYFRVFQQSQAIVAAFELLLLSATLLLWKTKQESLPRGLVALHVLMIATILASLSRSFWMGCAVAFVLLFGVAVVTRPVIKTLIKRHVQLGLMTLCAIIVLIVAVIVPPRPNLSDSSFYKSQSDNTREVAVSSRWNLLGPMVQEIKANPILGSGFGETVTFISDDPRLRAVNPTGEVTAYRFEWGYHDLWLKMGILGLFGFGWLFVTIMAVTIESIQRRDAQMWLTVGLAAGTVMIFITQIFSPYLNYPLGLGYLIFMLPFLPWTREPAPAAVMEKTAPAHAYVAGDLAWDRVNGRHE